MKIVRMAQAGGLESGDVLVTVEPNEGGGVTLELESVLKAQFGKSILETVHRAAQIMQVPDAAIRLVDRGALDHVILSRVQTALLRAGDQTTFDWSRGDVQ
ncbi:citrate lyase acyl carrier protein [Oscillospiraceae bacterium LTW-04]|nr:citrate lyase acyl carrier protein [Oscillospiraceae bacterium MB24-C1]